MSLRILHVLDHSIPLHSGYSFRTLSILREQHKMGWQTVQLTTPKQGYGSVRFDEVDGLQFHRTPSRQAEGLMNQMLLTTRRLLEIVRVKKPHLIHAHSPALNALPSLWVGRKMALPVVYEVRASWEDAAVDHGSTTEGSLRYRSSRALESFVLRHANEVTTICEGLRSDIVQRGIPNYRVTVIPNAVDTTAFPLKAQTDLQLRKDLGLDGAMVIGFVGSFYHYEGLDQLLLAAQQLSQRHPHMRVLLVGGGPQEAALREQTQALGMQSKVKFTGRIAQADVHRYYGQIDVLAYPRLPMRLTEIVTPLKPLEAMAQGQVVVASDVGGHRELIRHGDTGYLYTAGSAGALESALEEVIAQRNGWAQLRVRARHFVEQERTWKISVARYRAVYQRAMQQHINTTSIVI